jgi:hypothetical protein
MNTAQEGRRLRYFCACFVRATLAAMRDDEYPSDDHSESETIDMADNPALLLRRGVSRMLEDQGQSCLAEFTLRNGRRADLLTLAPDGQVTIVEIKASLADFRSDRKWREYIPYCDLFYFAVAETFPQDQIPADCGLIVADAFGATVLRDAPEHPMHATRRRALLLRYAHKAGRRLMQHLDAGRIR